jgi:hypothetical protein
MRAKRHADTAKLIVAFRGFAKAPTACSDVAGVTRVAIAFTHPTEYRSPLLDRFFRQQLVPST